MTAMTHQKARVRHTWAFALSADGLSYTHTIGNRKPGTVRAQVGEGIWGGAALFNGLRRVLVTGDTPAFADVEGKRAQWVGFARRIRPSVVAEELADVIGVIAVFVGPALAAAASDRGYPFRWRPGGPWTPVEMANEEPRE